MVYISHCGKLHYYFWTVTPPTHTPPQQEYSYLSHWHWVTWHASAPGGCRILCQTLILGLALWLGLAWLMELQQMHYHLRTEMHLCHWASLLTHLLFPPEELPLVYVPLQPGPRMGTCEADLHLDGPAAWNISSLTWVRINDCWVEWFSSRMAYFTSIFFTITRRVNPEIMGNRVVLCSNYKNHTDWIRTEIFKVTLMERTVFRTDQYLTMAVIPWGNQKVMG